MLSFAAKQEEALAALAEEEKKEQERLALLESIKSVPTETENAVTAERRRKASESQARRRAKIAFERAEAIREGFLFVPRITRERRVVTVKGGIRIPEKGIPEKQ